MLLAVDIGNSRTKLGVFDRDTLISRLSIPTVLDITSEALSAQFGERLQQQTFTGSIVCSVVPEVNDAMVMFLRELVSAEPIVIRNDFDFGLAIDHRPLEDIGTDRLVNAFSAVENYGMPCIVCSLGTAVTIDVVDNNRKLIGGLIAPGLKPLGDALINAASRLPAVEIKKTGKFLQKTTVNAMRSGITHAYLAQIEGLLAGVKGEIGIEAKVIATGGDATFAAENTTAIDVVDYDLTLNGLRGLFARSQNHR